MLHFGAIFAFPFPALPYLLEVRSRHMRRNHRRKLFRHFRVIIDTDL